MLEVIRWEIWHWFDKDGKNNGGLYGKALLNLLVLLGVRREYKDLGSQES